MDRLLRLPLILILFALPLSHASALRKTWNGSADSSWNTGANWTTEDTATTPATPVLSTDPPASGDEIIIPSTANDPILDITAANFLLEAGSITIQDGAELNVNDKGISMTTITSGSGSGTTTGSITINTGAELNINGGTVTGGIITNNGTLKFNGKEVTAATGAPFDPTTYTGSGEIHLVNTTGTDALTLPVSNSLSAFSGGITAAVTVNVTPSSRIVNLSGPTTIGTTGIGGVSKNFELNGGTLTGGTGETFTVTGTSSLGGTITSAANVSLNGNLTLSAHTTITTTGTAALTFGGTIDTAPAPVTANRDLTVTTGTANPAFSGNIGSTRSLGTLRIASGAAAALTVSPSIGASNLALTGTSVNYTLTNSANSVGTLAANTGSLNYRNSGGINIGTVGSTSGVNTNNNDFTLTAGGALSINNTVNAGTGTVSLQADGGIFQIAGGNITADKLKLTRGTLGTAIYDLNNDSNNVSTLAAANIGRITYYDADGFAIGKIPAGCTVGAAGCTSGVTTGTSPSLRPLVLQAGAGVTQSSGADIVVSTLRLSGTDASYSLNNSGNDAADIYGDVTGNISYNDSNAVDVGSIGLSSTTGKVKVTAGGNLNVNGSVSAGTEVEVTAGGNLKVDGSVSAGTSSVTLYSGGNLDIELEKAAAAREITAGTAINLSTRGAGRIINTGAGAQSAVLSAPTINLQTQSGSSGAIGGAGTPPSAVVVATSRLNTNVNIGNSTAGPGRLYLTNTDDSTDDGSLTVNTLVMGGNPTIWVQTKDGNKLVLPSTMIDAGNGSINFRSGTSLTTAGVYITATGSDGISLAARDAVTVDFRITTAGSNINITSDTSTITLSAEVSTSTTPTISSGDVVLNAADAVTQSSTSSPPADITADGLLLLGTGASYTLTNSGNEVNILAANTGAVSYTNSDDLNIETIGSTEGVDTNNNDFTLTILGTISPTIGVTALNKKVDAGTGNIVLDAATPLVNQNAGSITAGGLALKGTSTAYSLTMAGNTVTTLAADAGRVEYKDTDAVVIGTVEGTSGVKTNSSDFILTAGTTIAVNQAVDTGLEDVVFNAGGAVTQSADGTITSDGLRLLGTGTSTSPTSYTFMNSSNAINTLAADTGAVSYRDSGALTIGKLPAGCTAGAADCTSGVNTNGAGLTIHASSQITQSTTPGEAPIKAGAANFTAKTAAVSILHDIDLDESTNNFASVIFEGDNVTLRDSDALILGGSAKTSNAAGDLRVTTGGAAGHNLTDNGAITVTGITTLDAGTSGNVVLDNAANDFSSPDPRAATAATGGVTITNAANVTLVDSNDIQLNGFNITGSLSVTVPPTSPGASTMYNINQTQNLSIPGALTFMGNWNLKDLSAGLITASSTAAGSGNLIASDDPGLLPERITVSGNFRPDTFTPGDSTVIFSGSSRSQVGDNTPGRVTLPYTFNSIRINKDTASAEVIALNDWTIKGRATLTQGRWRLGANSHTINGSWNSNSTNFTFVSAGSTVTFAGGGSNVETRGFAPGQSFNNLVVKKTTGSRLTLSSDIKVDGNLTVQASSGAISTGSQDILIGGNWDYNADADAFVPGSGSEVIFSNTAPAGSPKQITSGGSSFNNISITGNSRVNATDALTVTGDLIFSPLPTSTGTAAPVLDIEGNSLTVNGSYNALIRRNTWPAPDELGRLRLRVSASVSIPASTSGPALGTVEYYGPGAVSLAGIGAGTGPGEYWNLVISGGAAAALSRDIRVSGYSGNPKGALVEPVEVEYDEEDDLMGLHIKGAGSSLDLNGKTLTLYGSFQNRTGGASGFRHGGGTVTFLGSHPALVYGRSTFFKFNINDQSGTGNDVGGKIVYFQQGSPITPASPVIEIANEIGAEFNILGDNAGGAPKSSCAPRKCLSLPDPPPSPSEWVYLVSSNKDTDWIFDKEPSAKISLKYVYIRDSDATIHPQSIPDPEIITRPDGTTVERDIVITESSPGWLRFILVKESITQDSDADGRIDRILVTSESSMKRKVDGAYDRLEIKVEGYIVNGYSDGPESTQFYINLQEGNMLDTDAVPKWSIINNETFRDAGVKSEVLTIGEGKEFAVPIDKARPIIGYALAAAGSPRNEVFIRFSEPVLDDNGGGWIDNFNFRALENVPGDISEVKIITPAGGTGLEEAVVRLPGKVTVRDIYENRKFIVEDVKDRADNELERSSLKYNEHRVSDLALGITGSAVVQPAAASGRTKPVGGSGVGTITEFDGTGFLEDDDMRIQAVRRKLPDTAVSPPLPELVYDNSVSASFRFNGLWLPGFSEGNTSAGPPGEGDLSDGRTPPTYRPHGTFSGLVPRPWNGARRSTDPKGLRVTSSPNTLFEYELKKAGNPKIVNNTALEFLFYMPKHKVGSDVFGNLYAARLIDDTAADWYRGVRPWGFLIRDFVTQAGGVTVLNNIINPMRSEAASLHYEVTEGGTVTVQVFDLSGNLVEILQRGYQAPGEYSVSWNGRNRGGSIVARGIYFIRYVGPGRIDQIRKVLVVK